MTSYTLLLSIVVAVGFVSATTTRFSCRNPKACPVHINCTYGEVLDKLNCCYKCALAPGKQCNEQKDHPHYGQCGRGLNCSDDGICQGKPLACKHGDLWTSQLRWNRQAICGCFNGDTICLQTVEQSPPSSSSSPSLSPPTIASPPLHVGLGGQITAKATYRQGETIRITCRYPTHPKPTLIFFEHKNTAFRGKGSELGLEARKSPIVEVDGVSLHERTYTIESANASHAGTYRCSVLSEGTLIPMTDSVDIEVHAPVTSPSPSPPPPSLTTRSQPTEEEDLKDLAFVSFYDDSKKEANELEIVSIWCRARGNPAPRVEIYKDGKRIEQIRNSIDVNENGPEIQVQFLRALQSQSGNYTCKATNRHGTISKIISLRIKPLPLTCTFERGHCHSWLSKTQWRISSGKKGGPVKKDNSKHDVTGHYIYFAETIKTAYLETRLLKDDDICGLKFHYQVSPNATFQVVVDQKTSGGTGGTSDSKVLMDTKEGPNEQWPHWQGAHIPHRIIGKSRIRFVATIEQKHGAYVALDDIQLQPCAEQ